MRVVFAASLCGIDCVETLYGIAVGSFGGSRETGFLYKKPASGDYLYKYPPSGVVTSGIIVIFMGSNECIL